MVIIAIMVQPAIRLVADRGDSHPCNCDYEDTAPGIPGTHVAHRVRSRS